MASTTKKPAAKKPAAKPAAKKTAAKDVVKPAAKKPAPKNAAKPAALTPSINAIADAARRSMLFDYYGQLLTDRQREVFVLYNEDNYSLGEIAEAFGISRQGVHDAVRKAEAELILFESKLGLVAKHEAYLKALKAVDVTADTLIHDPAIVAIADKKDADRIRRQLRKIRKIVSELDI
ncbi:MAG: YlxM family DNA-binding protein [Clostridiales Family XIII bacterium]|nr:YlxM family DNA-binding protein [Clostridiales Family XIII bacterium]